MRECSLLPGSALACVSRKELLTSGTPALKVSCVKQAVFVAPALPPGQLGAAPSQPGWVSSGLVPSVAVVLGTGAGAALPITHSYMATGFPGSATVARACPGPPVAAGWFLC